MVETDKILEAVELAKATGKIKKGTNEATKSIERGNAKLVVIAQDTNPKEIILHIAPLCKEKGVAYAEVPTKEELGVAVGIPVGTSAVAITQEGESKKIIEEIAKGE